MTSPAPETMPGATSKTLSGRYRRFHGEDDTMPVNGFAKVLQRH